MSGVKQLCETSAVKPVFTDTLFKGQPVYKGDFAQSLINISCINEPLLKGHLSIKDTFLQSHEWSVKHGFYCTIKKIDLAKIL